MAVYITEEYYIVKVYKDKGARYYVAATPKKYSEAKDLAEYLVGMGNAYKVEIHNPSVAIVTNDPNFQKGGK